MEPIRLPKYGTCAACAWWEKGEPRWATKPQKECQNGEFLHESDSRDSGDPASSLSYQYREGGEIWTGPEFGCVHFKAANQEIAEAEPPSKTEEQIVEQTNELARLICEADGYVFGPNFRFYASEIPRATRAWVLACAIQEHLNKTDAKNALANCNYA